MIHFLNEVDQFPCLYLNRTVLADAIRRYEELWLPLMAGLMPAQQLELVPPIDVEWVWHCHMLSPWAYKQDIAKVEGLRLSRAPIDHALLAPSARRKGLARAEALWKKYFPHECFDRTDVLKRAPIRDAGPVAGRASQISYDIAAAAERQMDGHYQTAVLPHYRDKKFLRDAADRYTQFLELKRRRPDGFWVPTFDIDVCWHAHILHPSIYERDTILLCGGRMLNHDDTVSDREEGSKLITSWEQTKKAWIEEFGRCPFKAGGMYRGDLTAEEIVAAERSAPAQ
jgi:hypothetical protein